MKTMERIQIGERTYPIKIDLNVLEVLQDAYGSITAFEMELMGLRKKNGDNGQAQIYKVDPSIKAIKAVLPLMINEGLEIEAASTGQTYEPVNDKLLIQECCIPYTELAKIIHTELKRCFGKK